MDDTQAVIKERISGASEVYELTEYRVWWRAPSGATIPLILIVKDAGGTLGSRLRYSCEARREDGVGGTASGNNGQTVEDALFNIDVHLRSLDVDAGP